MDANPATSWQQRWLTLFDRSIVVRDESEHRRLLQKLENPTEAAVVSFVGVGEMNASADASDFHEALLESNFLLRDGSSLSRLDESAGRAPGLSIGKQAWTAQIMKRYDGRQIALFGMPEKQASQAHEAMAHGLAPHSQIDSAHGFHHLDIYIAMALHQKPDLIVLAMDIHKQQMLARELHKVLRRSPCLIVCAGVEAAGATAAPKAALDTYVSGTSNGAGGAGAWLTRNMVESPRFVLRCMRMKPYLRSARPAG